MNRFLCFFALVVAVTSEYRFDILSRRLICKRDVRRRSRYN